MRCTKRLSLGVVVGLVLSLVLGAGDAVAADPQPTRIALLIVMDGPLPVAGSEVAFTGSLMSGTAGVPGRSGQLWVKPAGDAEFTLAATATTDSKGFVEAQVVLRRTSDVRWVFTGDAEYAASQSEDWTQVVRTRVGARLGDRSLSVGQRLVVRGATYPKQPGHTVSLWAGTAPLTIWDSGKDRVRLARAVVRADGSYRLVTRFERVGKRRLYVQVKSGGPTTTGFSPYRYVRVG